ncbi:MAG: hypothetical protein U1F66_04975 [bacterium]
MRNRRLPSLVKNSLLLILLLGCAPVTKISSSKNPGYEGRVFHKIMVEARGPNPQQNIQLEWAFRAMFDQVRVPVTNATALFPAVPPAQPVDRREVFQREGIDGILLVDLTNFRKDTIYHPPTSTQTEVRKRKDGSTYVVTSQSGDYTEHVMVQDHGLTLLSASELKPVWVGSASTSGDFKSHDEKSFYQSLAKQTVKDLAKAGLIQLGAPLPK